MKLNRKIFFNIHSWVGVKLSILFFIVCFSGTLATLSHEMDWLFMPSMRITPKTSYASKNLIVSRIKQRYPNANIQFWQASREPYLCDQLFMIGENTREYAFVNPHTGEIQGHAVLTFQRFFRDLHYYLFIPFQVGNFMVLVFGFLLFISLVTSFLFYKKWYKKLFVLTIDKGWLVFFRSLHRLIGLWSVPVTLIFSVTGIWYFIERANIGSVKNSGNPATPQISTIYDSTTINNFNTYSIDYDKAISLAKSHIPGLSIKQIIPPKAPANAIYINGQDEVPLVRDRANRVYIDPISYEVIKVQKAKELETIVWLNDIADPLHFGYWGGLVTKAIWFVFGLGISSLVFTGIWINQKRLIKKRLTQKKRSAYIAKISNWFVFGIMMVFMYIILITRYEVSLFTLVVISTGWLIFIFFVWYIFDYKLNGEVKKEWVESP